MFHENTSNNNDYLFTQLQEMFPQIEADVVYMIFAENEFKINEAIEILGVLSSNTESSTSTSGNTNTQSDTVNQNPITNKNDQTTQQENIKQFPVEKKSISTTSNNNEKQELKDKQEISVGLRNTGKEKNSEKNNFVKKLTKCQKDDQVKLKTDLNSCKIVEMNISKVDKRTEKIPKNIILPLSKHKEMDKTKNNKHRKNVDLNIEVSVKNKLSTSNLVCKDKNKSKDKKIEYVTVLSYVGVGKWNGLRLIFKGNGNQTPEVHGLTNSKQPSSIFRKKRSLCSSDKLLNKKKEVRPNEILSMEINARSSKETKSIPNKCMTSRSETDLPESLNKIIYNSNEQQTSSTTLISTGNEFSSPNITDSPISNVLGSSTPLSSQSSSVNHSNANESEFGRTGEPPDVQRTLSAAHVYPSNPAASSQQLPSVMSAPHLIPIFPPPPHQHVVHHPPPGYMVPAPYGMLPLSYHPPVPRYYNMNSDQQRRMTTPRADLKVDKIMYVLRGVPGSGKTFLAQQLKGKDGVVLSTDNYFIQQNGEYVFDPAELGNAHQWNQDCAIRWLKQGRSPIIIDNTNIESWELKPYVLAAVSHSYEVKIKEPNTWWRYKLSQLFKRNSHGVARHTIESMLFRFEKNLTVEKIVKIYGSKNLIEKYLSQQKQNGNKNINLLQTPAEDKSKQISPSSQIKNLLGIEKVQNLDSNTESKTEESNSQATGNKNTKKNARSPKSKPQHNTAKNQSDITHKDSNQKLISKKGNINDKLNSEHSSPKKEFAKSLKTTASNKNNARKEEVYKSDVERNLARIKSQLAADKKEETEEMTEHESKLNRGINTNKDSPKTKKRNRPSKPPVPRLLTSPLGADKDQQPWSSFLSSAISAKPSTKSEEPRKKEIRPKWKKSVATFTSESDFVLLMKYNNNSNFKSKGSVVRNVRSDRFIPSPLRTQQGNCNNLVLEKGTSTIDLREKALEEDKDIETLHLLFPDLKMDHLVDMYMRCDENVHWSIDVIATSTLYGDNDSLQGSPVKDSSSPSKDGEFINDMLITSTEDNSYFTNSPDENSEQYLDNEEDESKILTLSKEFLETIIKMATGYDKEVKNCQINVTSHLANQIYSAWKNTDNNLLKNDTKPKSSNIETISGVTELKQVFSRQDSYQDNGISENKDVVDDILNNQLKEDELFARRLQMEEDCRLIEITKPKTRKNDQNQKLRNDPYLVGVSTSLPDIGSPSKNGQWATGVYAQKSQTLIEIMKEETAAAKAENRQQHENKLQYLGSQMKREQLHRLYPEVPHNLIDDIFIANGCKFDETVHIIKSMFSDNDDDFYTTVKSLSSNEDNKLLDRIKNKSFTEKKNRDKKSQDSVELIDLETDEKLDYNKIRGEAARQRQHMFESYRKATLANHQKKGHLAMYYAQQAQLYKTKLRESNKKAASITYAQMNEKRSSDELDLHGLHVDEAIYTLKSVAARKQSDKKGAKHLYVITGKGLNSPAGVPRVKNAVLHWLETKNMKYTKVNEGYIKINLH